MHCSEYSLVFSVFFVFTVSSVSKQAPLSLCCIRVSFDTGCHICGASDHKRQSCQKYGMLERATKSEKPRKRYFSYSVPRSDD